MDVQIRPVERDDALALAALRLQMDRERGRSPRPGFLLEYADALLADFESYRGWIAQLRDGKPVGCALAQRMRKLPTLAATGQPEWWYVQQVFVEVDCRRHGVARRLMQSVQEAASEQQVRWLRLNSSDAGRSFFDSVGFTDPVDRLREWTPHEGGAAPFGSS